MADFFLLYCQPVQMEHDPPLYLPQGQLAYTTKRTIGIHCIYRKDNRHTLGTCQKWGKRWRARSARCSSMRAASSCMRSAPACRNQPKSATVSAGAASAYAHPAAAAPERLVNLNFSRR